MKKKKKNKRKLTLGVTIGGPTPGIQFQVDNDKKAYISLLPTDPFYCAAIYKYIPTPLDETIAVFSHCVKRPK